MQATTLSVFKRTRVKPYMQNKEQNPTVQGCHPKKEQIWEHFSSPAGKPAEHGLVQSLDAWQTHLSQEGCRLGHGHCRWLRPLLPRSKWWQTGAGTITGLVKMDPRGSSAACNGVFKCSACTQLRGDGNLVIEHSSAKETGGQTHPETQSRN